jgi:hypothetical protein
MLNSVSRVLSKIKIMIREKLVPFVCILPFCLLTSCGQDEVQSIPEETTTVETQNVKSASIHPYGGWYCPDNLNGFPPVNVKELATVPAVNGRMPTKEETQNGTSLMFFDPSEYPTAKPLDMILPRLAYYDSDITNQTELIIVIQAVHVDRDTVVGFRYINGGNGTSWYNEVDFLTDSEVAELGATPFVFLEAEINAPKEKIWAAITKTEYAKNLGEYFGKEEFFETEWSADSRVDLNYDMVTEKANGIVMTLFGNIYLQIDYMKNDHQSVEKILLMDSEDRTSGKIQLVFGPYPEDNGQQAKWENWLQEVKAVSEAE